MYRKVLVEPEIQAGERLLEQLDLANTPVTAAFWLYSEDADEWRLFVVSPHVASRGPRAVYAQIGLILKDPAGPPIQIPSDRIYLVSPHDIRYQQVRRATLGSGAGPLVSGGAARNMAGDDTYIYRVA